MEDVLGSRDVTSPRLFFDRRRGRRKISSSSSGGGGGGFPPPPTRQAVGVNGQGQTGFRV